MAGFSTVLVLLLLIERSLSVGSVDPQVQVKPLIITRGEVTDLRASFQVSAVTRSTADCNIHYVYKPDLSCGHVYPSLFSCDYEGALLYQHYGCLSEKELVTFQLSAEPIDSYQSHNVSPLVQVFSVELLVKDNVAFSGIELTQNHTLAEHTEYKLVFPTTLVGKCYYEILTDFPYLTLPSNGRMIIDPSTTLPCGYMPSLLHYIQGSISVFQDYILLRLYKYDNTEITQVYSVIPLPGSRSTSSQGNTEPTQTRLSIRQAINTPVAPDTFIIVDTVGSFGLHPTKYQVETHPHIGSFRTVQSTGASVSYTEFSRTELMAGSVAFYPDYNAFMYSPVLFRYSALLDVPGNKTITGEINVTIHDMEWKWPIQRTNRPLKVSKGQVCEINYAVIDFYLLDPCTSNATMQLSIPPAHGWLLHYNRSRISQDTKYLVKAVRDGTTLVYEHSGDDSSFDSMIWEISCINGPTMKVSMGVLIAHVDNKPHVHMNSSKMVAYQGLSKPLSMANFQTMGTGPSVLEAVVTVLQLNGTLIYKANRFNTSYWLFPFVKHSPIDMSSIMQFTLRDIQQQLVWYLPSGGVYQDTIELSMSDIQKNINKFSIDVDILESFNNTIFISTTKPYPTILPESPKIRILGLQPVYITSYYLHASVPPFSSHSVVYTLTTPPENGLLCIHSAVKCTASLTHFTQEDVNQQRLIFSPLHNFTEEGIKMKVIINGIKAFTENLLTLRIELKPDVNKEDIKPFWVYIGKEKQIRAWHFPVFPKNTVFRVTEGTVYGTLSYREGGTAESLREFTRRDLFEKKVWYNHDPTATTACVDSFKFNVILDDGNQTQNSSFSILIRHGKSGIGVNITNKRYRLFDVSRFVISRESFQVSSSFCPEFVIFSILVPPQYGVLSVVDVENNLVLLLDTGKTFTLKDVYTGLVHYTLINFNPNASNVTDLFVLNASDPVSTWPPKSLRQPQIGYFPLPIVTTPGGEVKQLDLKIKSPRPISWLAQYNTYGAIPSQRDIDISNSSVSVNDVSIQIVDINPNYEYEVRDTSSFVFTLEDAYMGLVVFKKVMFQRGQFRDTVNFDVIVDIESAVVRYENYSLRFVWALVELERSRKVYEDDGSFTFTIRRIGVDLWFESSVLLTTHSGTAFGANCSKSNILDADFCHLNQLVTFLPNMTTFSVTVNLLDNNEAESDEVFYVRLSKPDNAVLRSGQSDIAIAIMSVTIDDKADYAVVRFEGETVQTSSHCKLQVVNVDEGLGVLVLHLTRSRNIYSRAGVLCRTQQNAALEGEDFIGVQSEVWFEANQTTATCNVTIINDPLYESSELFTVNLEQISDGNTITHEQYSQVCVKIESDINDEPEVSFEKSKITVKESDQTGHFKIRRIGSDLTNRTVLQYGLDGAGTATLGDDFHIYTGDTDIMNCNNLGIGVGCVVFGEDHSHEQNISFAIKQDSVYEGNETFYLTIKSGVYLAHQGYPNRLEVTIVDSSEPSTIGFVTPHKVVNESTAWSHVEVVRTGNLDTEVMVTCVFKAESALFSDNFSDNITDDFGDVVISIKRPQQITFLKGENMSMCHFGVNNDDKYEVEERFSIYLETDDIRVVIPDETASTIVSVVDREDIPTVQFGITSVTVPEPLSNYDIDNQTVILPLVRTGDHESIVAVNYYKLDGKFIEEQEVLNQLANGIVTFNYRQLKNTISFDALADHNSNEDTYITVQLSKINSTSSVHVGKNKSVIVRVKNTELKGPILPGIPIVVNRGRNISRDVMEDSPLHCFSPCMPGYHVEENKQSQYSADCQTIILHQSIFSWEYSVDGKQFQSFSVNTALTTVGSQYLNPMYLRPGIFVRCSCTPVSEGGREGYARTSQAVQLKKSQSCKDRDRPVELILRSYNMFSARPEDLIEISVSLPRVSNALPIVLTRDPEQTNITLLVMESSEGVNNKQVCSSINNFGILSTHNDSWYSELNYDSCEWVFRVWLPLEHLEHECEASIAYGKSAIEVTMYVLYVSVSINQTIQVTDLRSHSSSLNYASTNLYLPPPLRYHATASTENDTNLYMYPLSVETNTLYFCSVADPDTTVSLLNENLTLLHTECDSQAKRIWKLSLIEPLSSTGTTIKLNKDSQCADVNCTFRAPLEFRMMFQLRDASFVPVLETVGITQLENSTFSSDFVIGDIMIVRVKLANHQKIQPGFTLNATKITLVLMKGNLTSVVDVWKFGGNNASILSADIQFAEGEDEITFQMNTQFVPLELPLVHCMLKVSWAVHNSNGDLLLVQTTDIAVTLRTPMFPTATPERTPPQLLHDSLKAAIGVFIATLLLASVTVTVVGLMICSWRGRAGIKKREVKQRHTIGKRISAAACTRTKVSKGTPLNEVSTLRRTHSTTGFPATVENYRRDRHKKVPSTPTRASFTGNRALTLVGDVVPISKSLPNLSEAHISTLPLEFLLSERRRNLNKIHTKVSMLNSHHTRSSTARKKLLKAYKVDNLKTLQEITPKRNNYGVNEGKINTEKEGYRKEYASFAVRSLAASAKTPEPGSSPRTAL